MARSTGVITRTTNGIATSAWAIGTRNHDVRRSNGGSSSAMRKPKPTVTADTPSGNDTTASSARPRRRLRNTAAQPPTVTASTVATTAYRSEVPIASTGDTNSVLPRWRPSSAR